MPIITTTAKGMRVTFYLGRGVHKVKFSKLYPKSFLNILRIPFDVLVTGLIHLNTIEKR